MLPQNNAYAQQFGAAQTTPEHFWAAQANAIDWDAPWQTVLDASNPPLYRWFTGGMLNTCYNAVDRHVAAGRGEQLAIIHDSAYTGEIQHYSYQQLQDAVSRFAGGLAALGVTQGDRVVIYLPLVVEAAIAMLACARIGAVHSVVFGGFAAKELAKRINDAQPKVIISASCGLEPGRCIPYKPMLDEAIQRSHSKPEHCIILQRPQHQAMLLAGRDVDWQTLAAAAPVPCVPVQATDPLYILYTSGTTGTPKGVVRDNGGHAVALQWSMHAIYGMQPGDVFWAASDVGWVVGHSYIVYGPLLAGCTTLMYEGKPVGTPDAGAFWRVIEQHRVNALFTAPTGFRAIRKEDPAGTLLANYNLASLRTLFLAGERCDPETLNWAAEKLAVPVIDHWWQTETGWAIAANPIGLSQFTVKPGSATYPMPGYDIHILNDQHQPLPAGQMGDIVIKLPLPPGTLLGLWQNEARYRDAYLNQHPGYYTSGDTGYFDADGYLFVMGRVDDVINVAGHRLSTGGMEEVLATHPDIAECAVVGAQDALKGQVPVGFVVLKAGHTPNAATLQHELVQLVRNEIGAVASFKRALIVNRLPKTRSGKILRATLRNMVNQQAYTAPATIDDPAILDEIKAVLDVAK